MHDLEAPRKICTPGQLAQQLKTVDKKCGGLVGRQCLQPGPAQVLYVFSYTAPVEMIEYRRACQGTRVSRGHGIVCSSILVERENSISALWHLPGQAVLCHRLADIHEVSERGRSTRAIQSRRHHRSQLQI